MQVNTTVTRTSKVVVTMSDFDIEEAIREYIASRLSKDNSFRIKDITFDVGQFLRGADVTIESKSVESIENLLEL